MPVVLVTAHGEPRAGYTYDDRTGISYEYPDGRYEAWITTGDRFVYHTLDFGYTGAGVIGEIRSSATVGRLVCDILDYEPWDPLVPLKDADGEYFEADPSAWTNGRVYWAQGVHRILEDRYDLILAAASAAPPAPAASVETCGAGRARPASGARGYASSAVSAAVDAYAMTAAMGHVASLWPTHAIEQMPRNNPGFDIRVGRAGAEDRYYEVKGMQASEPLFFTSARASAAMGSEGFACPVRGGVSGCRRTVGLKLAPPNEVVCLGNLRLWKRVRYLHPALL